MAKYTKKFKRKSKRSKSKRIYRQLKIAKPEMKLLKAIGPNPTAPGPLTLRLSENLHWVSPYANDDIWEYNGAYTNGPFNAQLPNSQSLSGTPIIGGGYWDFIPNGAEITQRIGREIMIHRASVRMVLDIIPGLSGADPVDPALLPSNFQIRCIHGWVKNGVNDFQSITVQNPTIYSEFDWSKFKILSDRVYNRRAINSGIPYHGGTVPAPVTVSTPSYKSLDLKFNWYPKRKTIFNRPVSYPAFTPGTGVINLGSVYEGYAPFVLIYNESALYVNLQVKYLKRVVTFTDP